jgi:hypothetical protein
MYEDALGRARLLQKAVRAFVDAPGEATLRAARETWVSAREPYMQTEGQVAIGRGDLIAVATQDEGDVSDLVALVAVWRGRQGLALLDTAPAVTARMRGYCGGAAVDSTGRLLAVSCPRGGLAVFWDLGRSRVIGTVDLPDGCGVALAAKPGTFVLTSGPGGALRVDPSGARAMPLSAPFVDRARWDNHLAVGRTGPPPG